MLASLRDLLPAASTLNRPDTPAQHTSGSQWLSMSPLTLELGGRWVGFWLSVIVVSGAGVDRKRVVSRWLGLVIARLR
ncbi:protein of unknown function [Alcaligenes faecalis subsp. faecalis]|nr:protein of unknown function [Alcaligenes faecalis subsp. faecalis]